MSSPAIFSARALLDWYDRHRRHLPWRAEPGRTPDPYRVWLSEIMLQQTTVTAVIPYYENFVSRFPTIKSLAAADLDEVLSRWAGLGYYARARNLHACAQAIVARDGFPTDVAALLTLPGIGTYTAAAIAAIGFGIPVVPVDGNVERVVSRLFALTDPLPGLNPRYAPRRKYWARIRTRGRDPAISRRRCSILARRFARPEPRLARFVRGWSLARRGRRASPPSCRDAHRRKLGHRGMGYISG